VRAPLRSAYDLAGRLATALSTVVPAGRSGKVLRAFEARHGVLERFERWSAAHRNAERPLLWIHAPSVGEGLQARPILELFRSRRPEVQLVYTFFSPSAEGFARGLPADYADYLPFDSVPNARRILASVRPTALVFAKLDVWPLLAAEAHAAGVKLGLISGTLSAGAGRQQPAARTLLGSAYAMLDAVGAISSDDAQRLVSLGVRADRMRVTGDTRYDQVWQRARAFERALAGDATPAAPMVALVNGLRSTRPTLVAGSTWPPDEQVLLRSWEEVQSTVPHARLVIVPHEPTAAHLAPLERWAADQGLRAARPRDAAASTADVVLVDSVGMLAELYALGNAAYVGGGFGSAGLHSVLEPAAFGLPVAFGPRHANSRDATVLLECEGASEVRDHQDASDVLSRWLGVPEAANRAGRAARAAVEAGLGAAEVNFALVEELAGT
jgi:3-deoxy-D-manno-octulosonic-acid transferase